MWKRVGRLLDRVADVCGILGAGLLLFIMVIVSAGVLTRSAFNKPIGGAEEIAQDCLLYCAFLMAIWLMRQNGHARVDLVINMLKPKGRALANIILYCVCAAICLVITWFGTKVVIDNLVFRIRETSYFMTPTWILMIIIPVGMLLLFFQVVRTIGKYRRDLTTASHDSETEDPAEALEKRISTEI
jgi:C4-dicarboxylate transporter, DctQ subunit